jgi:hypothetical protein
MLTRSQTLVRRVVALLLVLFVLLPSVADAANDTADTALPLDAAHSSVSDSIVGNPGGAYRYYRFHYQGGSAPVVVSVVYQPGFASTGPQAFGFNLYGPSGLSFNNVHVGDNGFQSTNQYTLAYPAAMDVLVQVYNYTAGMQISYTLTVSGITGGSTATVTASASNTSPGTAATVSAVNAVLGGSLVGNAAGAFHYYTLNYPGGNSPLTVTMNATPVYNGQGQGYGFNLYRPSSNGSSPTLVATGYTTAQIANGTSNSMTITQTIHGQSASQYQLQVYNYWPNVSISYGITVTGLSGPTPPASGNSDSAHAIVLNSARPGATGTLAGNHGGTYAFYLVNYPGQMSQFYLSVTYSQLNGAPDNALGFQVFEGAQLEATVNPSDDGTGVHSAVWTYQNQDPTTFGIEVFNYAPGATVSYTIYETGSQ